MFGSIENFRNREKLIIWLFFKEKIRLSGRYLEVVRNLYFSRMMLDLTERFVAIFSLICLFSMKMLEMKRKQIVLTNQAF